MSKNISIITFTILQIILLASVSESDAGCRNGKQDNVVRAYTNIKTLDELLNTKIDSLANENTTAANNILNSQKTWCKELAACRFDTLCIEKKYKARILELSSSEKNNNVAIKTGVNTPNKLNHEPNNYLNRNKTKRNYQNLQIVFVRANNVSMRLRAQKLPSNNAGPNRHSEGFLSNFSVLPAYIDYRRLVNNPNKFKHPYRSKIVKNLTNLINYNVLDSVTYKSKNTSIDEEIVSIVKNYVNRNCTELANCFSFRKFFNWRDTNEIAESILQEFGSVDRIINGYSVIVSYLENDLTKFEYYEGFRGNEPEQKRQLKKSAVSNFFGKFDDVIIPHPIKVSNITLTQKKDIGGLKPYHLSNRRVCSISKVNVGGHIKGILPPSNDILLFPKGEFYTFGRYCLDFSTGLKY